MHAHPPTVPSMPCPLYLAVFPKLCVQFNYKRQIKFHNFTDESYTIIDTVVIVRVHVYYYIHAVHNTGSVWVVGTLSSNGTGPQIRRKLLILHNYNGSFVFSYISRQQVLHSSRLHKPRQRWWERLPIKQEPACFTGDNRLCPHIVEHEWHWGELVRSLGEWKGGGAWEERGGANKETSSGNWSHFMQQYWEVVFCYKYFELSFCISEISCTTANIKWQKYRLN